MDITADDIITAGRESGADELRTAQALKQWSADLGDEAARQFASEPDKFSNGMARVRDDTDRYMAALQMDAMHSEIARHIADPEEQKQFITEFKERGFDLDKATDDIKPLVKRLDEIAHDPVFSTSRPRPMNVLINGTPAARSMVEDTASGSTAHVTFAKDDSKHLIQLPHVTDDDVRSEIQKSSTNAAKLTAEAKREKDYKPGFLAQALSPGIDYQRGALMNQKLEEAAAENERVQRLKQGGRDALLREHLTEVLKKPEFIDRMGDKNLAGDVLRGLAKVSIDTGRAYEAIAGGDSFKGADEALQQALPGSSAREFRGGFWDKVLQGGAESVGQLLPTLAAGGASKLLTRGAEISAEISAQTSLLPIIPSSYGRGYTETNQYADALEAAGKTEEAAKVRSRAHLAGLMQAAIDYGTEVMFPEGTQPFAGRGGKPIRQRLTDLIWNAGKEGIEEPVAGALERGVKEPLITGRTPDLTGPMPLEFTTGAITGLGMKAPGLLRGSNADGATSPMVQKAADVISARATPEAFFQREVQQRAASLSEQDRVHTEAFAQQIGGDLAAFVDSYHQQHGNVIDADKVREMYEPFAKGSPDERGALTAATTPVVAAASRFLTANAIATTHNGSIVFQAGGPSSGKSTALDGSDVVKGADVVIDAPMSTQSTARGNIQAALDNGNQVTVQYVHMPVEEAVPLMLERARKDGREVTAEEMATLHFNAQQTFLNNAREFADNPNFHAEVINNTGKNAAPMTAADLQSLTYPSLDETRQRVNTAIANEFDQNTSDPWYSQERRRRLSGAPPAGRDAGAVVQKDGPVLLRGSEPPQRGEDGEGNGGPGASSLKEWKKSTFGTRLRADDRLRSAWRASMGPHQYRRESEAEWQQRANDFIAGNGVEGAFAMLMDPESGLSPSDQIALGLQLILTLDAQIRQAEAAGDSARVEELDNALSEAADHIDNLGTKMGQGVRVFGMWTRMSAEGVLRAFEKKVNQAREDDMAIKLGGKPEDIAADIKTAAAEEREDVASEALGETISEQLAQLTAQVQQLRQQLAEATALAQAAQQEAAQAASPADAAQAGKRADEAENTRKRAQRDLASAEARQQKKAAQAGKPRQSGQKKPKPVDAPTLAARLVDRLRNPQTTARRKSEVHKLAADYTAGYINAAKLQASLQALGVDASTAASLPPLLDSHKDAAAKAQVVRQAQGWIDRLATSQGGHPVERQQQENSLAGLIRDYLKAADAASLPDFIAQASSLGVPAEIATQLQRQLDTERKAIAAIARERAIARLVDQLTPALASPANKARMPRFLAKLFDAHELGALERPEFLKAYAEAFDLPVMDAATRARIKKLIDAQKAAPEGFLKQEATTKLMGELANFKGIGALDIATAFWYANVLSGLGAQGVNVWGNAVHLLLRTLTIGATHNPRETWNFIRGLAAGAARGQLEARAALASGNVPYRGDLNFSQGQTLELLYSDDPKTWTERFKNGIALGRFVFRALSAGDALFFHTAREGRAWLEASRYAATQQKLNGGNFADYLAEQLNHGPTRFRQALAQAQAEASAGNRTLTENESLRRAWEILEQLRPADLNETAKRFGTLVTFSQEPEGTMGAVAALINDAHRRLSLPSPWGPVRVLTPFIPFVNIVANVTSSALDFTPVGIARGVMGRHVRNTLDRSAKDFSPWEARQRIAAGMMGTLGTGLAFSLAYGLREQDDDRVPFMIYGMGPNTKARRDQMPKGWKPFTIKVGNHYVSYSETPLALVLAVAGNTLDYLRYTPKAADERALGAAAYALSTSPKALLKTGVLSSINDLFNLMEGQRSWSQVGTRTASGFIPGQALLRDIAELFHGDKIDDTSIAAGLLKDVPIIREMAGKPALNVFGEPVTLDTMQRLPILKRIVTGQGDDPDTRWLAQHKLWIPGLDNQVEVGAYLTEPFKHDVKSPEWRENRIRQQGRAAADVLTADERYKLVQLSGPTIRTSIAEMKRDLAAFPSFTREELQSRLSAKVVAQRRLAMQKVLGIR